MARDEIADDARAIHLLEENTVTAISYDGVPSDDGIAAKHERCSNGICDQRIAEQTIAMGIHGMNSKAGILHVIVRHQVGVGIGEINAIAFVADAIAGDLIRFGFPEMNTVAAPRSRQLRGANDIVAHDSATLRATDINAEGVILDPAIGDGGVV